MQSHEVVVGETYRLSNNSWRPGAFVRITAKEPGRLFTALVLPEQHEATVTGAELQLLRPEDVQALDRRYAEFLQAVECRNAVAKVGLNARVTASTQGGYQVRVDDMLREPRITEVLDALRSALL